MYNFLVLGMIPGTQIQITFETWFIAFILFVAVVKVYRLITVRRQSILLTVRIPLHANQLHLRG